MRPSFRVPVLLLAGLLLGGCGGDAPVPAAPAPPAAASPGTTAADEATRRLQALFDAHWQRELAEDPTLATYLGDPRHRDRWENLRPEAIEAAYAAERADLDALGRIDPSTLSAADALNYELFRRELEERIAGQRFKPELLPLTPLRGVQLSAQILEFMRFEQVQDYEAWLARLQGFGVLVDQTIALMRRGAAEGRVLPRVVMQRVVPQIAAQRVARAQDSAFYAPFRSYPDAIAADVRTQLDLAAQSAVMDVVIPAFERLQKFLESEYLPACPENRFGLQAQPDGEAHYAWRVRRHTGTDLTPEQIHALGLREVERLQREIAALARAQGHADARSYLAALRANPRYRYSTPEALLDAYRAIAKRIDPELPRLFATLPRTPYGVRAIPREAAPSAPAAYYYPPAADGSRAGFFYANTDRPETRNGWEMEALTAHETVPGHHLQLALANELGEQPAFRRHGLELTAFVEGWGLYAESLGSELGLYTDPAARFGKLSFELWRAARLVVDTGLHAKGWSRRKARTYLGDALPRSADEIAVEVDRYIAMPGQALAYKIGELKFQELRARARERLGSRFDVRAFHDQVLGQGALPLEIVEENLENWLRMQAQAAP